MVDRFPTSQVWIIARDALTQVFFLSNVLQFKAKVLSFYLNNASDDLGTDNPVS